MKKNEYLREYQGYIANKCDEPKTNISETTLDVENITETKEQIEEASSSKLNCFLERQKVMNNKLKLTEKPTGACLFIDGWRSALCKCDKCLEMCEYKFVIFLKVKYIILKKITNR